LLIISWNIDTVCITNFKQTKKLLYQYLHDTIIIVYHIFKQKSIDKE